METPKLIIITTCVFFVVWWILLWFCTRGASAYDLATGNKIRINNFFVYDSDGNIRNVRSYDTYISNVHVDGLCEPGDVLLCEFQDAVPGEWCIWWDITTGPYVYRLTEEDCVEYVNQKLPIITYTANHEQA